MKILVVDDEKDIVDLIHRSLVREGYEVITAYAGEEVMELMKSKKPDLVILDLMLPGIQGLEVCKQIRANPDFAHVPILILSAKSSEVDRVLGLEMGADDYMTKPFSMRELISRIAAAFRRIKRHGHKAESKQTFTCRGLSVDFDKYEVVARGKKVDMSPIEVKLLFFCKNAGRVYSRDQVLDQVWGNEVFVTPRTVDVHISRLRKVIEKDPEKPEYIVTVRGVGYKFDDVNHSN
jgi:DNA-binding response OmpR family regulator